MKKVSLLLISLLFISYSFAQVKQQNISKSSVVFHIKNFGLTVDGTFAGLKGDVRFDPANLAGSSIEATVQTNTIDTDNGTRNDHLKSDSYFDADKYPQIRMKSVSFKHRGGDRYVGVFDLTIKNVTRSISMPFTYTENAADGDFKGSFEINRTDYGVGGSSMIMADKVIIDIDVSTSK